jgi:hypothetical protein
MSIGLAFREASFLVGNVFRPRLHTYTTYTQRLSTVKTHGSGNWDMNRIGRPKKINNQSRIKLKTPRAKYMQPDRAELGRSVALVRNSSPNDSVRLF